MSKNKILDRPRSEAAHRELSRFSRLPTPGLEGADVQLPLEVLGDDGAQKAEGLRSVDWGVSQGDGGGRGWVLSKVYNHLHCFQSISVCSMPPSCGRIQVHGRCGFIR